MVNREMELAIEGELQTFFHPICFSIRVLFEKRRVSFIYFIVDKIIILFSESFKDGSPYKYNCD